MWPSATLKRNTLPACEKSSFSPHFLLSVCHSPSPPRPLLLCFCGCSSTRGRGRGGGGPDYVRIKKKKAWPTCFFFKAHQTQKKKKQGHAEAGFQFSVSTSLLYCARHLKLMFIALKTIISRGWLMVLKMPAWLSDWLKVPCVNLLCAFEFLTITRPKDT